MAIYGTQGGIPVEVMVDLLNTAGADGWFPMPHQATDGYISHFAGLVRDRHNWFGMGTAQMCDL